MADKNGWASIRAIEITIEPGDGFDVGKAIAATISSLGWAPAEQEFNLSATVGLNGPTDPPPVAGPTDPPPVAGARERPSRPGLAKVEPPRE